MSIDVETGVPKVLISTDRNEEMPGWASTSQRWRTSATSTGALRIWFRRPGVPDRAIVSPRDFTEDSTSWFMGPAPSPGGERAVYSRVDTGTTARLWISAAAGIADPRNH